MYFWSITMLIWLLKNYFKRHQWPNPQESVPCFIGLNVGIKVAPQMIIQYLSDDLAVCLQTIENQESV